MKPTRRGFLGGMAGAVAAGPATLASMMQAPLGQTSGLINSSGSSGMAYGMASASDSYADILKKQLKVLSGMSKAELREEHAYRRSSVDQFEIDSLRSVSPRHKLSMLHERQIDREHALQIKSLVRQIFREEQNS